jgi:hypothetical protein
MWPIESPNFPSSVGFSQGPKVSVPHHGSRVNTGGLLRAGYRPSQSPGQVGVPCSSLHRGARRPARKSHPHPFQWGDEPHEGAEEVSSRTSSFRLRVECPLTNASRSADSTLGLPWRRPTCGDAVRAFLPADQPMVTTSKTASSVVEEYTSCRRTAIRSPHEMGCMQCNVSGACLGSGPVYDRARGPFSPIRGRTPTTADQASWLTAMREHRKHNA